MDPPLSPRNAARDGPLGRPRGKIPPWETLDINVNLSKDERVKLHRERELSPETARRELVLLISEKRKKTDDLKRKLKHTEAHWKETTQPLLLDRFRAVENRLNEIRPELESARGRYAIARAQEEVREDAYRKVEAVYERQQRGLDDVEAEVADTLTAQADRKARMELLLRELVEIKKKRADLAEEIQNAVAMESVQGELTAHLLSRAASFVEDLSAAAQRLSDERSAIKQREEAEVCPLERQVDTARRALTAMEARTATVHEAYARVHSELVAAVDRAASEDVMLCEEEYRASNLLVSRQKHLASLEAQLAREQEVGGRRLRQPDRQSAQWAHEKYYCVRDLVRAELQRCEALLSGRPKPERVQLPYRLSSRNPLATVLTTTEDLPRQRAILLVKELRDLIAERSAEANIALTRLYADAERVGLTQEDVWRAVVPAHTSEVDQFVPAAAADTALPGPRLELPPLAEVPTGRENVDHAEARQAVDGSIAARQQALRAFLHTHAVAVEEESAKAAADVFVPSGPSAAAVLREHVDSARDREADQTASAIAAALSDTTGTRGVRPDPNLPARLQADAEAVRQWRSRVEELPGQAARLLAPRDAGETLHRQALQRELDRAIQREARRADDAVAAAHSPGRTKNSFLHPSP